MRRVRWVAGGVERWFLLLSVAVNAIELILINFWIFSIFFTLFSLTWEPFTITSYFSTKQLCDNWTPSVRSTQNYCVTAAFIRWSHQSIFVSDSQRSQVFAFGPDIAQRHQTGKFARQQQLCSKGKYRSRSIARLRLYTAVMLQSIPPSLVADMRFWFGARRRARPIEAHDTRGGHTILSKSRNFDGFTPLCCLRWCMVGRLHIRWIIRSTNFVPSTKSSSTTGTHYRIARYAIVGRYATRMRRCPIAYATQSTKTTITVGPIHIEFTCNAWSRSSVVSDAGLWSGKFGVDFTWKKEKLEK